MLALMGVDREAMQGALWPVHMLLMLLVAVLVVVRHWGNECMSLMVAVLALEECV
jgi:hypothetical protein